MTPRPRSYPNAELRRTTRLFGMADAPDFTLLDQAGEPWTLGDQRGHAVVLLFLRGDW